jgi:hypothetical protein
MTDEELNEYLKPEYRMDAPAAPAATPAAAITGPAGQGLSGLLTPAQRQQAASRLFTSAMNPDAETGSSSLSGLVSTKPDWYEGGPPPQQTAGLGALKSLLGSVAEGSQQQANLSAKEPLRHFAKKQADQGRATTMSALSGVVGGLIDRPQQNYAQELDAAKKQAEMYKTLHSGNGQSDNNLLGLLNYDERVQRNDELQQETQRKAELQRQMKDPNSEVSKARQKALVDSGVATYAQVQGKSADDLDKDRTAFMQTSRIQEGASEFDRRAAVKQAEELGKANVQQVIAAENEKRDEERRREQARIPGVQWAGSPPAQKTQEEVRNIVDSYRLTDQAVDKLRQDQEKLNQKGVLIAAGGNYAPVEGIAADDEAKALIEDAKQQHRLILDAYRRGAAYGVMNSNREQEFAEEVNQKAATPMGWLVGPQAWESIKQRNAQVTKERMKARSAYLEGDPDAPDVSTQQDRPAEQMIHRFALPQQHKRGGEAADIVVDPLSAGSPSAAPQQDSGAGKHNYRVTLPSGKTVSRPLSSQEALVLTKKLGADKVQLTN